MDPLIKSVAELHMVHKLNTYVTLIIFPLEVEVLRNDVAMMEDGTVQGV